MITTDTIIDDIIEAAALAGECRLAVRLDLFDADACARAQAIEERRLADARKSARYLIEVAQREADNGK